MGSCGKGSTYEEAYVAGLAHDLSALRAKTEGAYEGRVNFPLAAQQVQNCKNVASFLGQWKNQCQLALELAKLPQVDDWEAEPDAEQRRRVGRPPPAVSDSAAAPKIYDCSTADTLIQVSPTDLFFARGHLCLGPFVSTLFSKGDHLAGIRRASKSRS